VKQHFIFARVAKTNVKYLFYFQRDKMMIHEVAELTVSPQDMQAFEQAVNEAAPHFQAAEGCHALRLEKVIEHSGQYRLIVAWESVEAHMVTFRESAGFQAWRSLAGPFFTEPPKVYHLELVVAGF
jgi:quinol monooxygenase YgiN